MATQVAPSAREVPPASDVAPLLVPLDLPPRLQIGGGQPLGLKDVLQSLEVTHPKLEKARQKVRESEGKRLSAHGNFDLGVSLEGFATPPPSFYDYFTINAKAEQPIPVLGAKIYGGWRLGLDFDTANDTSDIQIPDYSADVETFSAGEVFGGFSFQLWKDRDIDSARRDLWSTAIGVEASEAALRGVRLQLALKAAADYWKWVAAGRSYQVVAELVELATTREKQLRTQFEFGAKSQFDVLETRRSVLKRATTLIKAQRKLENAAIKLSLSLRDLEGGAPRVPTPANLPESVGTLGSSEILSIEEALDEAMRARPELMRVEAELEQARLEVELADNSFAPKVELSFEASQDLGRLTNDDDNFSSTKSLEDTVIKTKLKIDLPVPFRNARGKQAATSAARRQIAEDQRNLRDAVAAEVRDAYSALRAAMNALRIAQLSAEAAERVAEGERQRFFLGQTDLFTVNAREQQAAEARTDEIEAKASLQIAYAEVLRAVGVNVSDW